MTIHFSLGWARSAASIRKRAARHGVIALDVYGTLVDPSGIAGELGATFGVRCGPCSSTPPWLVSGNPFDVVGAKACGMKAAWLRRDPRRMFDPWEFSADIVARDLEELCESLQLEGGSPPP